MSPFWQSVVTSLLTGGSLTVLFGFLQFLIRRHDEKKSRTSGTQAELKKHGEQLDDLTRLVKDGNSEQIKTRKKLEEQGHAIAGLEHDRIIHIGDAYIKKGWISQQDYNDIDTYLYQPYRKLGGNGTAERVMEKLKQMESSPEEKK